VTKHMHAPVIRTGRASIFRSVGLKPHIVWRDGCWQWHKREHDCTPCSPDGARTPFVQAVQWCDEMQRKALLSQFADHQRR